MTASFGPAASYTKDKIVDVVNAIEPPAQVDPSVHEVIEAPVKDESEHAAEDLREPKKILTAAERHAEMQRVGVFGRNYWMERNMGRVYDSERQGEESSVVWGEKAEIAWKEEDRFRFVVSVYLI